MNENVIEWLEGDKEILVTLSQKKFVNKVLRLAEQSTNNVVILARNDDGSILARVPLEMLKLAPKRQSNISEERKEELRTRLARFREQKNV